MSDLYEGIRTGLAANLATIPDTKASAYMKGNPTPPWIEVFPDATDYNVAAEDDEMLPFTVQAFVGNVGDKAAQQRLDKMLALAGTYSVKAAIESDLTLGGKVETLRVSHCSGYQQFESRTAPGALVLGAQWTVEVYAPKG